MKFAAIFVFAAACGATEPEITPNAISQVQFAEPAPQPHPPPLPPVALTCAGKSRNRDVALEVRPLPAAGRMVTLRVNGEEAHNIYPGRDLGPLEFQPPGETEWATLHLAKRDGAIVLGIYWTNGSQEYLPCWGIA